MDVLSLHFFVGVPPITPSFGCTVFETFVSGSLTPQVCYGVCVSGNSFGARTVFHSPHPGDPVEDESVGTRSKTLLPSRILFGRESHV